MSISSHTASNYARSHKQRYISNDLQQHDSAMTLNLPSNNSMEGMKSELAGLDINSLDQQTLRDFGMAAKRAGSITSGFASRDTSPERGSIASYKATSRPGTAHTYSAAEVKKLYAAGPRSFAPSSVQRPGLETGDVVALMSEGKAYKVSQTETPEDEPGTPHYVFKPASTDDVLSDKAAHLEVIRQGDWIGFRSASAEDRFLQLRRRGRQKLAFHSANFGVWEQWELVAGEPKQAWNTQRMGLRNRQLPQVVLTVDVVRVGTYALLPNASMTSRSLIPLQGDVSENEELMKMSGLMIYEWFHFVDKEKQVRIRIDGKVIQMMAEAAELKQWTISEIEAIRSEMDIEVNRLIAIIHKKNVDLTDLETKLVNRLRWGIVVLQSKNENLIRRQVLQWWRMVAVYQHSCAHKVARQLQRRSQMAQAMAFDVWTQYTQHCHDMRVRMQQMVTRAAYAKLRGTFAGWAHWAAASAESRTMLRELEQQAIWRMQRWCVLRSLSGWRTYAQSCKAGRHCLEGMQLRIQRRRAAAAFQAWHQLVRQSTSLQQVSSSLAVQLQQRSMHHCLQAWQVHTVQQQAHRRLLARLFKLKAQSRLSGTFQAWRGYVANFRERKNILQAQWAREVHYIQRRAINKWRFAVAEDRRLQHAGMQIRRRAAACLLWQAFAPWRDAAKRRNYCSHVLSRVLTRLANQQMGAVLICWRQQVQRQHRTNRLVAQRVQQTKLELLYAVVTQWRQLAQMQQRQAAIIARCQRRHKLHLLQQGFLAFSTALVVRKTRRSVLEVVSSKAKVRTTRRVFAAWMQAAESSSLQREEVKWQVSKRANARHVSMAFIGWCRLHTVCKQDAQRIGLCRRRADRGLAQQVWKAWHDAVVHHAHVKQTMANAILRICHRCTAAAFDHWREHVVATNSLQQHTVQRMQKTRLHRMCMFWRALAAVKQQHKVASQKIKLKSLNNCTSAVFRAWHNAVVEGRRSTLKMQQVIGRMSNMRLSQAFGVWQAHVDEQIAKRQQLKKAVAHLQRLRCSAVLFGWFRLTQQTQATQGRLLKAVRWMGQRTLATAFAAWSDHTLQMQSAKQAMRQVAARLTNRQLAAAFYAWHEATIQKQHAVQSAHKALLKLQQGCMAAAFDSWVQAVHTSRHSRQVLSKAVRRITNLKLSQAFAWWRDQAQALRAAHARANQIILRMQHQSLASAFYSWLDAVLGSQQAAAKQEQLVDAAVARNKLRLVGEFFEAWRERSAFQVSLRREAAMKLHRLSMGDWYSGWAAPSTWLHSSSPRTACKAATLAAWSHAVKVKQNHSRLLQRCLRRRADLVLLSRLRAWRAVADYKRQQRVALVRLLSKHLLTRKYHAFHRWHAAWQERCQALERLRICISRKRISFRLFKQWYWESFDDDVQATLGHMFNATEEAISSPLPSPQPTSPRPFSPMAQGRLLQPHSLYQQLSAGFHAPHLRDFGSLFESPAAAAAAGSSEVLLLENHDGSHLNPTQARFSRFASGDSDPSSLFGAASRMFRNSSAGHSLRPGNSDSSLQQNMMAGDPPEEPSHVSFESHVSQTQNTGRSAQYSQQELVGQQRVSEKSISGNAMTYHFRESEVETSSHSRLSTVQHSQASSVDNTDGRTRLLSPAHWLQQPESLGSSPEAASSAYDDPDITGFSICGRTVNSESPRHVSSDHTTRAFSMHGQGLDQESPHHVSSDANVTGFSMFAQGLGTESVDLNSMPQGMQSQERVAESGPHYSWSVHSQSYAGSAGSPGRDSLHSWTDATPIRGPAPQDPASPDARTILRSIARECQHAVEGKSPVVQAEASGLSPPSRRPDLSRTPNTFFNPSFDADDMSNHPRRS